MNFPKARLTAHASQRLAARSMLDEQTLIGMFNLQLGRKIGVTKCRSHLLHRLYWSPADQAHFVAIQDVMNGSILTILSMPLYDGFYPDQATERARQKVLNRAVLAGYASAAHWTPSLRTTCYVTARLDGMSDAEALGCWTGSICEPSPSAIGSIRMFWDWVSARIRRRGLPLDRLVSVELRLPFGEAEAVPFGC
jgi:hypothetical protein